MTKRNPWHLVGKYLWRWTAGMAASIAILLLYILLGDEPFGIQFATLITYTLVVFYYVFLNTRLGVGFDLRSDAVRRRIPHLLAIHLVFLTAIFAIQTAAFALKPKLSNWWLKEGAKHQSPYSEAILVICVIVGMMQILLSRRILKKRYLTRPASAGVNTLGSKS